MEPVLAWADGTVDRCDAYGIGYGAFLLGAGRLRADEAVHPGVGVLVHAKPGRIVRRGEPLATLVHADRGLDRARAFVGSSFSIDGQRPDPAR